MQASLTTHKFMYAELQAGPIKWIKLLALSLHIHIYTQYIYVHIQYIMNMHIHFQGFRINCSLMQL